MRVHRFFLIKSVNVCTLKNQYANIAQRYYKPYFLQRSIYMIHTTTRIGALALMFTMIAYADQIIQQDITHEEEHELILVNNEARDLCRRTVECWHKAGLAYNDADLDVLLDPQVAIVEYKTLLGGLKSCLNEQWAPATEEEIALRTAVQQEHDLVQAEYEELVSQMGTRRIKIKYFAKVVTGELVVGNTATINNLIVNNCIKFPNLGTGVLQTADGCITTTVIPPFSITAGSIGTAELADGAVTTPIIADAPNGVTSAKIGTQTVTGGAGGNIALATITAANLVAGTITGGTGTGNIAAGTITGGAGGNIAASTITAANIAAGSLTQANLAFNTVQTVSSEPNPAGLSPLLVYRGLINTAGAIQSGAGFTVGGTPGTGLYTITLGTAYTSTTSYSVIVQPGYIGIAAGTAGFFSVTQTSPTVFSIQFFGPNGTTATQPTLPFSFFTIGS